MDQETDQSNVGQTTSLQEKLINNESVEESKEEITRRIKIDDESCVLEPGEDNDEMVSFEDIEDLHEDILDERKVEEMTEDDDRENSRGYCLCFSWKTKKPQPPQNEWLMHFKLLVKNTRFIKNSWSGGLFALINNRFSEYSSTESEQKELHRNAFSQVELIKKQRFSDEQQNDNQPDKNIKKILANSVILEEDVDSLRQSQASSESLQIDKKAKIMDEVDNKCQDASGYNDNNESSNNNNHRNADYEDYIINSSKENNNDQKNNRNPVISVSDSSRISKIKAGETKSKLADKEIVVENNSNENNDSTFIALDIPSRIYHENNDNSQSQGYIEESFQKQTAKSVETRLASNEQITAIRNGSNPQSGSNSRKTSNMSNGISQQVQQQSSTDNFNESSLSNGSDSQIKMSKLQARKKIGRSVEIVSKPSYLKSNLKTSRKGLKSGIIKKNNSILGNNTNDVQQNMRCNTLLEESESLKAKDWELYEAAVYYKSITYVIEEHLKESNNFEIEKPLRVIRDNFLEFYISQYGGQLQKLSKSQVAASVRDLKEFVTLFLEVIREYYALDALVMNFRNADCFLTTDNLVNFLCSVLFQDDLLYSIVYAAHTHFDKRTSFQFFQSSKELEPYLLLSQLGVKEYYCLDETTLLKVLYQQRNPQGNENNHNIDSHHLTHLTQYPEEPSNNSTENRFQQSDINSQNDQSFFSSSSSQTIYKKPLKKTLQKELEQKYNISANQLKPFRCPYEKAIEHLKTISFHRSPVHKLKVIIKTQELINQCIKDFYEHFGLDLESISYDADNLLSIFSYILIKSKVYDIMAHLKIIENFATKNTLNGSAGYLVVTLTCCIRFINSIDIPALLQGNQLIINKKK